VRSLKAYLAPAQLTGGQGTPSIPGDLIAPANRLLAAAEAIPQLVETGSRNADQGQNRCRILRGVDAAAIPLLCIQGQRGGQNEQRQWEHVSELLHGGSP
jgi:hypothetical protein